MDKPKGIDRDDGKTAISFIDLNQPITVILASSSGFFLEGINRVLRNEKGLIIAWDVQNQEEIEKSLDRIKPDILFIDNRALKFDVRKILALISSNTRLILLGDGPTGKLDLPNVTYLNKHTSSSELIFAMRRILYKTMTINIEEYKPSAITSLPPGSTDQPETIIELTEEVFYEEEEEEEIKLFDNEISLNINAASPEFDELDFPNDHWRKKEGYSRLRAFGRFSLLLITFGVIYFGAEYRHLYPDLRGFISFNSWLQTDSKIEHDIRMAVSDQGFQDIDASVNRGKVVLSGKVSSEEDYRKAGLIAKEVKGVKEVENHLVVEKTVTNSKSIIDAEEMEFLQHTINEEPEKEISGTVSYLNTNENAKSNIPVVEKKEADSESTRKAEMTQSLPQDTLPQDTHEDPEEKNRRKVSSPDGKNDLITRPAFEKEANESRRMQILAELQNELKKQEVIEVTKINTGRPEKLESRYRVSALPPTRDHSMARDIEKALAREGYEDIQVSVKNGEVFLTGGVETHFDHIHIHRIALRTGGVKKIRSVLGVSEYSTNAPNIEN